ncbi:MAG: protein kinase [Gemmatimonadetes bacterium]|nr:protein kinase [Gemmatimonadota bacterium]
MADDAFAHGDLPGAEPIVPGAGDDGAAKVCPFCGTGYGSDVGFCPRDGTALRPKVRSNDLIGQIVAERYHILKKLGEGGMGQVYLAEHVKMGRRCAIKVMHPALRTDADAISRFGREAANASRINHPHVADVYDFGESRDGLIYLAMEFVEGEPLSLLLRRESPLPVARATEITRQVADALVAAHEIGLVHRDLKPDNILLARGRDGSDVAKVVDFGIAKAVQSSGQNLTRTGFVVGTLHYMSPEQLIGDPIDGRSDVYSLGCILYEMLVGERPFDGPSGEVVITRRLTEPPPRPRTRNPAVPEALDKLVVRALARSPGDRIQSAAELRDSLRALSPGRLAYTPPSTPPNPVEPADPLSPTPASTSPAPFPPPVPRQPPQEMTPGDPETRIVGEAEEAAAGWEAGEEAKAAVPKLSAEVHQPLPDPKPGARDRVRGPPAIAVAAMTGALVVSGAVAYLLFGSDRSGAIEDDTGPSVVQEPSERELAAVVPPISEPPAEDDAGAAREQPGEPAPALPAAPAPTTASEPEPTPPPTPPEPPRQAELRIGGTLPPGARVTVNNRSVSERRLSLSPDRQYLIRITASGFVPVDSVFTLQAGEQRSWSPTLRRVEAPPPAPQDSAPPRVADAGRIVPPSPPAPAPESREVAVTRINEVIARYASAIESRDIQQVRSIYPGLSQAEQNFWQTLFGEPGVRGLRAEVSDLQPARIEGNTAQGAFTVILTYRDSGGAKRTELRYQATLERGSAGDWRLRSLRH